MSQHDPLAMPMCALKQVKDSLVARVFLFFHLKLSCINDCFGSQNTDNERLLTVYIAKINFFNLHV